MDIVRDILADREKGAKRLEAEYKERLYAVALRLGLDPTEAEGLVYRTIDEAVRGIEGYTEQSAFFAWLCKIMINCHGMATRRKSHERIVYTDELPDLGEDDSVTVGVDQVVQAVDGNILHEAISRLPPKLRETVVLRYFMDMSLIQISRFLMIPVGTVNSRLHMARTVLSMRLGAAVKKPAVAIIAVALMLLGATAAVWWGATDSGENAEVEGLGEGEYRAQSRRYVEGCPMAVASRTEITAYNLEDNQGETEMNIKQKAVSALAAATLSVAPIASGAILSGDATAERIVLSNRVVLVYSANGTLKVNKSGVVDVLLVGGGGGGGANSSNFGGGGGGAGGVIYRTSFPVEARDEPYTVTVGAGGTAGTPSVNATAGGDSSVFGLTAYGGGYGAKYGGNAGGDGASGGGGTATQGSPDMSYVGGVAVHGGQGNAGGASAANRFGCGGGGGAGAVGCEGDGGSPGAGGSGIACDIIGTNVWYGGGGAGFRNKYDVSGGVGGGGSCVKTSSTASTAEAGVDGLGGGGCGGAAGGRGVVIVSFALDDGLVDTGDFELFGGDRQIPMLDGTVHVFTNSGTLTVNGSGMVEILAVGGGGGGGSKNDSNANYGGAGGGGGGVAHFTSLPVTAGTYSIVVGAGGEVDANGGNTTALGVTAFGGGAGARYDSRSTEYPPEPYDGTPGKDGASGGGACRAPYNPGTEYVSTLSGGKAIYALYGNAGHNGGMSSHQYGPGGGGGAGAPGGDSNGSTPGSGGDGLPFSITGREVYYGGGGAGARYNSTYSSVVGGLGGGGAIGEPGRDGFGGGGSGNNRGGSGIVVIRYGRHNYAEEFKDATGGTMKRRNGHRIHTFTESDTFSMPCVGKVEVLLVGGGGGGGYNSSNYGGAGGGGGGVIHTNMVLSAGSYMVTVGQGGAAGGASRTASNGSDTMAFGWIAHGGGYGAQSHEGTNGTEIVGTKGGDGATGGGSTHTRYGPAEAMLGGASIYSAAGNLGQGGGASSHVFAPSGGGGAGAVGGDSNGTNPGVGGAGYSCDISGEPVCYGGGGAGFRKNVAATGGAGGGGSCLGDGTGAAGTDGLGGGGCGGYKGGSGVVIVRYRLPRVGTVISIH